MIVTILKMLGTIKNNLTSDKNRYFSLTGAYFLLFLTSYDSSAGPLKGNDQYEGFCIDIIDELSQLYGFQYEFIDQLDKHVGNQINKETKEWE